MTTFTAVINIMLIALIASIAYDFMTTKPKSKRKIKVYVEETNKIAFIAPQKKASDEDIEEIHLNLVYTYDEVIMVPHDVIFKGAYHKG